VICFLDMDGVLADFLGGCCRAHNRPSPYTDPKSFGIFELETLFGISGSKFWEPCNGASFWDDLDKMPDADDIVRLATSVFGVQNIAILTAPSMSSYCVPGKRRWIKRQFPQFSDQMIFTGAKRFLAGPDRVLIDDRSRNIEDFRQAGGTAITVPRLWNDFHLFAGCVTGVLSAALAHITAERLTERTQAHSTSNVT